MLRDLWLGIGSALGGSTFVIQSTDGGATWTDRSAGLPPVPVCDLVGVGGRPLAVRPPATTRAQNL